MNGSDSTTGAAAAASVAFYLGVALLFTHELDAMPNHEWRVLPLIRALPDELGEAVFLFAHVPLFALVIGFVASLNPTTRLRARYLTAGFLVLHALLHFLFSGHPAYDFGSPGSSLLIYGAALAGALYLLLARLARPGMTEPGP